MIHQKICNLGADLFSEEHEDFVIFRDGRFVTDEFVYASEVCYERATGEEIDIASLSTIILIELTMELRLLRCNY